MAIRTTDLNGLYVSSPFTEISEDALALVQDGDKMGAIKAKDLVAELRNSLGRPTSVFVLRSDSPSSSQNKATAYAIPPTVPPTSLTGFNGSVILIEYTNDAKSDSPITVTLPNITNSLTVFSPKGEQLKEWKKGVYAYVYGGVANALRQFYPNTETGGGNASQFAVMPTLDAQTFPTYQGIIAQYTGATDAAYAHGHFYEPHDNGDGTYSWQKVNVGENDTIGIYTPYVSNDGIISWTNNEGLENPPAQDIKGQAATIKVGDVTSGDNVAVTNVGTATAATFNFVLQRGEKGEQGAQGAAGKDGESAVSAINPRGDFSNAATYAKGDYITYTDGDAYVCKVDTSTGVPPTTGRNDDPNWQLIALRGADGNAATVNVGQVATLTPNSEAYVNNAGTVNAAVLNFGIPKGDKGDKGDKPTVAVGTVETIPAGQPAAITDTGVNGNATFNFKLPRGADASPTGLMEFRLDEEMVVGKWVDGKPLYRICIDKPSILHASTGTRVVVSFSSIGLSSDIDTGWISGEAFWYRVGTAGNKYYWTAPLAWNAGGRSGMLCAYLSIQTGVIYIDTSGRSADDKLFLIVYYTKRSDRSEV